MRAILQWMPRPDVFRLSRVSLGTNHVIASAITPDTAHGNSWWIARLDRDVRLKQLGEDVPAKRLDLLLSSDEMSAVEKYVLLMPNTLDRLRFAIHAQSPAMLEYITRTAVITLRSNFRTSRSDVSVTPAELEQIIDLVNQQHLSDKILRNAVLRSLTIPVMSLLDTGRVDLATQLLSLPSDHSRLLKLSRSLADTKNPAMLELFRLTVTHRNFAVADNTYEAVREIADSGSAEAMAILLSVMPLVRVRADNSIPAHNKRSGVDTSKGYAVRQSVKQDNAEMLQVLISAGADPHPTVTNVFREAASLNRVDLVRILTSSPRFVFSMIPDSAIHNPEIRKIISEGKLR